VYCGNKFGKAVYMTNQSGNIGAYEKVSRFFASLGPGIMVSATAIGLSHIVLAPIAGARFGYALIWVVVVAHVLKYPCFEFGPRYTLATGKSLIAGYAKVPGPKRWALWLFFFISLIGGCTAASALLSINAAVASAATGAFLSLPVFIGIIGAAIVVLLAVGGYRALAFGSKIALAILLAVALLAFFVAPPPLSAIPEMFTISFPVGSLILVSSLVGLMPTAVHISVWHSIWALEHKPEWEKMSNGKPSATLRLGMRDLRVGYVASAIIAVVFTCLGATVLLPRGLTPQGIDVIVTVSRIYTELLADWMYPVFMATAFIAVFSSAYAVLDAFPRSMARMFKVLMPNVRFFAEKEKTVYWLYLGFILFYAILSNTLLPNPVVMVLISGVATLIVGPMVYGLNYYCVTRHIDDPEFMLSRPTRVWALAGIFFMFGVAVLTAYTS
jgi:Mn2+/Fe2+ NRAMP family transporter